MLPIASGPTLAAVAPPVPRKMIRIAGMSMNDAGLVPSIRAPTRIPAKAMPIAAPVDSFIVPYIGRDGGFLQCTWTRRAGTLPVLVSGGALRAGSGGAFGGGCRLGVRRRLPVG